MNYLTKYHRKRRAAIPKREMSYLFLKSSEEMGSFNEHHLVHVAYRLCDLLDKPRDLFDRMSEKSKANVSTFHMFDAMPNVK